MLSEQIAQRAEGMILLHAITASLLDESSLSGGVWQSVSGDHGNCYPVAAAVALAAEKAGYKAVVVHGRPTLQVAPFKPYDHAWVEVETRMGRMAVDLSNGCNAVLSVERYYELGKTNMSEEAAIYTPDEVWQLIVNSGHYGPFHIPIPGQESKDG
jgi:hypothetical protein